MATQPTIEQQQAFAAYQSALANANRARSFETIRGICERVLIWGPAYEAEARLALAYALDDVLEDDTDHIEELEDETGVNHELGHVYCARKSSFKRQWGICDDLHPHHRNRDGRRADRR